MSSGSSCTDFEEHPEDFKRMREQQLSRGRIYGTSCRGLFVREILCLKYQGALANYCNGMTQDHSKVFSDYL